MSDLCKGWTEVRLADIAEVRLGRQRSPKNHSGTHMRPYLRAANVDWNGLKLDDVKTMNFTDEEAEVYRLQVGDIVLSEASGSASEVGKPALWNAEINDCCFQNTLLRVRSYGVDRRYLLHYLRYEAIRGAFAEKSRGVGIHHLGAEKLANWPIRIPPLGEQRRIVTILEAHLSRLDAAAVSVLAAVRKAGTLRRRTLANLVTPDSSDSWKKCRLEDVAISVRNGMYISRPGHEPNGVPILRISAVRSLALDLSDLRYTAKSPETVQKEGYLLRGGDLLFIRYNGNPEYVGACAVAPETLDPLTYPDKLIRVSPDMSLVDPEYLAMTCSAGESRKAIRSAVKTTAGQAGISGGEIKRILLHLPDIKEQRRRAAEFQEHDEAVRHVEKNVRSVARREDYLRRSLLTEAFAGMLAPQDPAEEPASVLLERIRTGQAAQPRAWRRPKTAMHAPQEETLL